MSDMGDITTTGSSGYNQTPGALDEGIAIRLLVVREF
jgi:hypothetical protein